MRQGMSRRMLFAAVLFLGGAVAPLPAGEGMGEAYRDLVMLLRMRQPEQIDKALEAMLQDLNPQRNIRHPVTSTIAQMLRNPGFQEYGAFFEVATFAIDAEVGHSFVAAFPLRDPDRYRQLLTAQAGVREEGTQQGITTYRRITSEGAEAMYFTVSPNGTALFGTNLNAMQHAQLLYQSIGPEGYLTDGQGAIDLRIHIDHLTAIHAEDMSAALREFRQDFLQELFPLETPRRAALDRGLVSAFEGIPALLGQFGRLDVQLHLPSFREASRTEQANRQFILKAQLHLREQLQRQPEAPLPRLLLQARQPPPLLCRFLPPESVSFRHFALWPALLERATEAFTDVGKAIVGGGVSQSVRDDLTGLLTVFQAAGPREMTTALLPATADAADTGPVILRLIRWERPERLPAIATEALRVFRQGGPLDELLRQNGIEQTRLTRVPNAYQIGNVPVDRWTLHLRSPLFPDRRHAVGLLGQPAVFLAARREAVSALVSVPPTVSSVAETPGPGLAALQSVFNQFDDPVPGPLVQHALAQGDDAPAVMLSAFDPLRDIALALESLSVSTAKRTTGATGRSPDTQAQSFRRMAGDMFHPVVSRVRIEGTTVHLRARMPHATLRALVRACLDIEPAPTTNIRPEDSP